MNCISAADFESELRVSPYDYAASWLVALLILVGFAVSMMGIAWLTSFKPPETISRPLPAEPASTKAASLGSESQLDEPNQNELDELLEPQLESALAAVTDVLSTQAGRLETLVSGEHTSGEDGAGDGRTAGPDNLPAGARPRWDRWRIKYNTRSLAAYAEQLDEVGIELGVAGGGRAKVDYASQLGQSRPRTRQADGSQEKRLYFTWRSGKLKAFDRQLLAKARIPTRGRLILQFLPKAVEARLAALEREFAKDRPVADIRHTVFGVRQAGSRHEFYVESMQFRANSD